MSPRDEANRRPDLRRRHLGDALLSFEYRPVRRHDARSGGGERRNQTAHERFALGSPIRRIRSRMDERKQQREGTISESGSGNQRAPDRNRRRTPARNDALAGRWTFG